MAHDNLPIYSDFNETFKNYKDASAFQLGAVISQKDKPITFCSRKVTDAQQRYTVIDKELLTTEETLKEFKIIPLGQKLRIYTDHKILSVQKLI